MTISRKNVITRAIITWQFIYLQEETIGVYKAAGDGDIR